MRRIAVINQKGGVGKTTTVVNLGAALALLGRRVVVVDVDPQANASLHLGVEAPNEQASTYSILTGRARFADALLACGVPGLSLVPSNLELSGAELELAGAIGRERLLRDALEDWERDARAQDGRAPADYVLFDCPPSLGLLSINALAAAREVLITLQTEFFALQGIAKLVEVVQLMRRRLNPELAITGILPCLYDSRLRLAREVLAEIKSYFPGEVFAQPVRTNVKLAEAPSYGRTIFEYAADSNGAADYLAAARRMLLQEGHDAELASLPTSDEAELARRLRALAPETSASPATPAPPLAREASAAPQEAREERAPEAPAATPPDTRAGAAASQAADEPAPLELEPVPPPRSSARARPLRATELPPLPADAFESLTSYLRENT